MGARGGQVAILSMQGSSWLLLPTRATQKDMKYKGNQTLNAYFFICKSKEDDQLFSISKNFKYRKEES